MSDTEMQRWRDVIARGNLTLEVAELLAQAAKTYEEGSIALVIVDHEITEIRIAKSICMDLDQEHGTINS